MASDNLPDFPSPQSQESDARTVHAYSTDTAVTAVMCELKATSGRSRSSLGRSI